MPIWIAIIVILAVGAGAAVVGALVGAIVEKVLKGKKLAVLGEGRVGKTVLINFLTKGTFSDKYVRTAAPKKTDAKDFKLKDLELKIEELIDISGRTDFYDQWRDLFRDSDIVLYLLRLDKLQKRDKKTEERIKRDIGQIERWLKEHPKKFPSFIIGTYGDLMNPDLTSLSEDEKGDYEEKLRRMPILQEIALRCGGGSKARFIFGSLKSKDTTEELVYRIIEQVVNHNG